MIVTEPPATETEPPVIEPPIDNGGTAGLTYINGILVVNKTYPLPKYYNPGVDATA